MEKQITKEEFQKFREQYFKSVKRSLSEEELKQYNGECLKTCFSDGTLFAAGCLVNCELNRNPETCKNKCCRCDHEKKIHFIFFTSTGEKREEEEVET